jgi:hypothetical protein
MHKTINMVLGQRRAGCGQYGKIRRNGLLYPVCWIFSFGGEMTKIKNAAFVFIIIASLLLSFTPTFAAETSNENTTENCGGGEPQFYTEPVVIIDGGGEPQFYIDPLLIIEGGGEPQIEGGGEPQFHPGPVIIDGGGEPQFYLDHIWVILTDGGGEPQVDGGGEPQMDGGGEPQ